MNTLRSRHHKLGNQINLIIQRLAYAKTVVEDLDVGEKDKANIAEILKEYDKAENDLLTLDQDLVRLKNTCYRLIPPDKDLAEYDIEIKKANKGVKILVVDDLEDVCDISKKVFERRGFQVDIARSFEEANQKIGDWRPDVVLLDLYLVHGMEGLDVLRMMKKEYPSIKCIVVTLEDDEGRLKMVKDLGADEILIKPVGANQLEAKINGLLFTE